MLEKIDKNKEFKGIDTNDMWYRNELDIALFALDGNEFAEYSRSSLTKGLKARLKAKGYDSIAMNENQFVVFDSNQIKSVNNKGGFNGRNPNIYYDLGSGRASDTLATASKKSVSSLKDNSATNFMQSQTFASLKDDLKQASEYFFTHNTNKENAKLFESVIKAANDLGVEFEVQKVFSSKVKGKYNTANNRVTIFEEKDAISPKLGDTTLHELIHSVTSRALLLDETGLKQHLSAAQRQGIKEIKQVYDTLKNQHKDSNLYAFKNTHEFVAELSKEHFREFLKEQGLMRQIINGIAKIITFAKDALGIQGAQKTNAYKITKDALEKVINNYKSDFSETFAKQGLANKINMLKEAESFNKELETFFKDNHFRIGEQPKAQDLGYLADLKQELDFIAKNSHYQNHIDKAEGMIKLIDEFINTQHLGKKSNMPKFYEKEGGKEEFGIMPKNTQGKQVASKDIIKLLESSPNKGRDMPVIGRENLNSEVLEWALENNKKIAVDTLPQEKAKEFGFKYPLEVKRTIDADTIKHILNKHGKNSIAVKNGEKEVGMKDIQKWTQYADEADLRVKSRDNLNQEVIVSGKQINGHYVIVESIRKKHNELGLKTMYFSNGKLEDNPIFK